jgi:hypothetical protein
VREAQNAKDSDRNTIDMDAVPAQCNHLQQRTQSPIDAARKIFQL